MFHCVYCIPFGAGVLSDSPGYDPNDEFILSLKSSSPDPV